MLEAAVDVPERPRGLVHNGSGKRLDAEHAPGGPVLLYDYSATGFVERYCDASSGRLEQHSAKVSNFS